MKALLQWLVRLYPRSWRGRYESEFRILLDEAGPRWADAFDLLKEVLTMRLSHLGPVVATVLGGATAIFLTVAAFQFRPVQWESQAILSIRVSATARPTESQTPAISYFDMSQRVLSRPALLRIVEKEGLYPDLSGNGPGEEAIERLRKNVTVTPLWRLGAGSSEMFVVAFRDRDPFVANQVTRDLVTGFADETVRAFDRLLSSGIPPVLARKPALTLEFFYPAKRSSINWTMVIGLALVEGSQLGLIFALLRRRRAVAYT